MLLYDLIFVFITERIDIVSDDTTKFYMSKTKSFFNYFDANSAKVEDLTRLSVIQYLSNPKWKKSTKNKHLTFIKTFLNYGIENEYIVETKDIERILKIKPYKADKEHYKTIPQEEFSRLLEYYNNMPTKIYTDFRNKIMLGLCLSSGIRRTELSYLTPKNINWDNNSILLEHTKNGKQRYAFFDNAFKTELKRYVDRFPSDVLFGQRTDHNERLTAEGISWVFSRMEKDLGFTLRIHDIRHTFATLLARDGVDVFALKELMGHTNLTTTQIYIDLGKDKAKKALEEHNLFKILQKI